MLKENLQKQLRESGYIAEFDLSSLVESCGDKFRGLEIGDWMEEDNSKLWYAKSKDEIIIQCSTPEEAVANLWLELNKK